MSSEARLPPPSAVSRGGTPGAVGATSQNLHHLPSTVLLASGAGITPPPTTSAATQQQAAVAAAMSAAHQQHLASVAAAHQYQAAALQAASLVASQQPTAHHALLAQYQSLAAASAAGISPDVLLKQFPHLAGGLPPHLLTSRSAAGAGTAAAAHQDLLIARERELAERERVVR